MWFRCASLVGLALAVCGFAAADDKADKSSKPRIRLGGVMVNAGYSRFAGPGFYPYYYGYGGWPYYFHPGFLYGYAWGPNLGEIKLKTEAPDAWVYIDGALAGKAEKLKSMWLEPGKYELEIRSGERKFGQKVYVLSGKTLRLNADLARLEVRP